MNWDGALRRALEERVFVDADAGGEVRLEEKGEMAVTLFGVAAGAATMSLRSLDHLSAVKQGEWRQKCDYIVLVALNQVDYAVMVELKKTVGHDTKPLDQLVRTKPIVEYLAALGRLEDGPRGPLDCRYVVFARRFGANLMKDAVRVNPKESARRRCWKGERFAIFAQDRISLDAVLAATRVDENGAPPRPRGDPNSTRLRPSRRVNARDGRLGKRSRRAPSVPRFGAEESEGALQVGEEAGE